MRHFLLSLILFIASLGILQAGTIDPRVSDQKYIEYGKQHECVVEINGIVEDQPKARYRASAVLIKPRIALTAAHVVKSAKDCYITLNGEKIHILASIMLEKYKHEDMGPYDIAICYLEKEAKLDFYPSLYDKDDEVGKTCSIAGFGFTGTFDKGISKHDNNKRAGSNKIDGLANGMLLCSVNKPPKTALEFMICSGDSGGGLFIDNKLAGINSCIMTNDGKLDANYNEESLHTRISIHKEWIEFMVEKLEALEKD